MRSEIDASHNSWYDEAVTLAEGTGTVPARPRPAGRQVHRENVPAVSTSDYFKMAISIPFLDHLLCQMQTRFSETNLDALDAIYGMPTYAVSQPNWLEGFSRFLEKYEEDLPEPRFLKCELEMWRLRFRQIEGPLPTTIEGLLPYADIHSFPNILTAIRIFGTISVTTCSCERSISTLRRLKSYMRSTMGEKRLLGLSLVMVHPETVLNIDDVINRFARKYPRRIMLADIQSDE